ncbi:proline-rich protein 36-like [Eubalaena glacialis]|uniref:proline-rich protein 36-like n=1 Tax=Eubalaena glacialis TaxID=27606 RepID=UPI002A598F57|nr:proline-rich protein 36-like [Eubalaena glacialis]
MGWVAQVSPKPLRTHPWARAAPASRPHPLWLWAPPWCLHIPKGPTEAPQEALRPDGRSHDMVKSDLAPSAGPWRPMPCVCSRDARKNPFLSAQPLPTVLGRHLREPPQLLALDTVPRSLRAAQPQDQAGCPPQQRPPGLPSLLSPTCLWPHQPLEARVAAHYTHPASFPTTSENQRQARSPWEVPECLGTGQGELPGRISPRLPSPSRPSPAAGGRGTLQRGISATRKGQQRDCPSPRPLPPHHICGAVQSFQEVAGVSLKLPKPQTERDPGLASPAGRLLTGGPSQAARAERGTRSRELLVPSVPRQLRLDTQGQGPPGRRTPAPQAQAWHGPSQAGQHLSPAPRHLTRSPPSPLPVLGWDHSLKHTASVLGRCGGLQATATLPDHPGLVLGFGGSLGGRAPGPNSALSLGTFVWRLEAGSLSVPPPPPRRSFPGWRSAYSRAAPHPADGLGRETLATVTLCAAAVGPGDACTKLTHDDRTGEHRSVALGPLRSSLSGLWELLVLPYGSHDTGRVPKTRATPRPPPEGRQYSLCPAEVQSASRLSCPRSAADGRQTRQRRQPHVEDTPADVGARCWRRKRSVSSAGCWSSGQPPCSSLGDTRGAAGLGELGLVWPSAQPSERSRSTCCARCPAEGPGRQGSRPSRNPQLEEGVPQVSRHRKRHCGRPGSVTTILVGGLKHCSGTWGLRAAGAAEGGRTRSGDRGEREGRASGEGQACSWSPGSLPARLGGGSLAPQPLPARRSQESPVNVVRRADPGFGSLSSTLCVFTSSPKCPHSGQALVTDVPSQLSSPRPRPPRPPGSGWASCPPSPPSRGPASPQPASLRNKKLQNEARRPHFGKPRAGLENRICSAPPAPSRRLVAMAGTAPSGPSSRVPSRPPAGAGASLSSRPRAPVREAPTLSLLASPPAPVALSFLAPSTPAPARTLPAPTPNSLPLSPPTPPPLPPPIPSPGLEPPLRPPMPGSPRARRRGSQAAARTHPRPAAGLSAPGPVETAGKAAPGRAWGERGDFGLGGPEGAPGSPRGSQADRAEARGKRASWVPARTRAGEDRDRVPRQDPIPGTDGVPRGVFYLHNTLREFPAHVLAPRARGVHFRSQGPPVPALPAPPRGSGDPSGRGNWEAAEGRPAPARAALGVQGWAPDPAVGPGASPAPSGIQLSAGAEGAEEVAKPSALTHAPGIPGGAADLGDPSEPGRPQPAAARGGRLPDGTGRAPSSSSPQGRQARFLQVLQPCRPARPRPHLTATAPLV